MSTPAAFDVPQFGPEPFTLRARWVFPGWGPPHENGTVEITAGRISAIHDAPCQPDCDLGNTAIIPGLVNAHTHLELSDVTAPLEPAQPFTEWLKQVMQHRRGRAENPAADEAAVAVGRTEAGRHGTTTISDISGRVASDQIDPIHEPRTVAFLEVLGLSPERATLQLQRAGEHLSHAGAEKASRPGSSAPSAVENARSSKRPLRIIRGLSPHAPYSVHPDLFRRVIDLAVQHHAPVAMHLAETREELELLATGTGAFVPFLEELGVWRPDAILYGSRPLDYLRELARVECALVIHGNYLADDEIEFLASHPNLSVVYCPRTHAYFGHAPHPWRTLLARGANLALGTDSRASNPDLSLFAELLFLRQLAPDLDPAQLLKLGTLNGAFSLGLEHETGSLTLGKSADIAIVALPETDQNDPYALLFDPASHIVATICSGEIV